MYKTYVKTMGLRSFATGFLTGILILLLTLTLSLFYKNLPFSLHGIYELHKIDPVLWIVDFLPIGLALMFYYVGNLYTVRFIETQNKLTNELSKSKKTLDFTQHLIQDKLSFEYEVGEDDQIGKALINLRNNLLKNKNIEHLRRKEDDQRNWVAEGLAKFSEILRKNNDDLNSLAYSIINNLVKYMGANQGGFFILQDQDEDKYFEMSACYAYDRRKFADKRVSWGDGLIGTCALEKKTIYMTNIPKDYVTITSGLGKATPSCLLIVPLIVNDGVHGVLEIASFKKFEPYQIEFIEKVAESIASTISTVKINVRTARLLKESQEQAEILASQEEQMRQNMEELQATQEEAARQNEKFISFTNSVNHTLIRAEFLADGTLIYANNKFIQKLGYNDKQEVEGRQVSMFINKKDKELFDNIWQEIIRGNEHFEGDIKLQTRQGKDLWTMATLTPQKKDNEVDRIIFLAIDTTDQKKQSLDFEAQIAALNSSSLKAEFTPDGDMVDCNEKFLLTYGYTPDEISSKTIFDFISREEVNAFKEIWGNVNNNVPFQGQIKSITKSNDEKWFRGTLSVVNDMYGEVSKVIYIANDITKEKIMEIETQHQTEQLKIQEEKLRESGAELSRKLDKAKAEMELQYKEVEKVKIRNERTLEGALDAIVTINQEGRIEFFNKAAEDLWGLPRKETTGLNVRVLFSEVNMKEDEFTKAYVTPGAQKLIGQRREIKITNKNGDDIPVLFLLSEARVDDENTYTAFIQNIEVELF